MIGCVSSRLLNYASMKIPRCGTEATGVDSNAVKNAAIFPVHIPGGDIVQLKKFSDNFYLPDRSQTLYQLFSKKVAFLALQPTEQIDLKDLLAHFDLDSKRMEHHATHTILIDGLPLEEFSSENGVEDDAYSDLLTEKLPYFYRLVLFSILCCLINPLRSSGLISS